MVTDSILLFIVDFEVLICYRNIFLFVSHKNWNFRSSTLHTIDICVKFFIIQNESLSLFYYFKIILPFLYIYKFVTLNAICFSHYLLFFFIFDLQVIKYHAVLYCHLLVSFILFLTVCNSFNNCFDFLKEKPQSIQ